METCVDIFEKFQTLIVGLLGFFGVIVTLLVNSWLDRRQHSRQVDHERNVLRSALLAELGTVRNMLSHRIETLKEAQSDGSTDIMIPITDVSFIYQNTIDRLGLLKIKEIEAVTQAYLLMHELPDRIRFFDQKVESPEEHHSNYFCVGSNHFKNMQTLHENFLSVVETAINLLDK